MDWIKIIRDMVDKQFHYQNDEGDKITLIETNPESKCQKVVLEKSHTKTFTIELDKQKIIKEFKDRKNVVSDVHVMLNEKGGVRDKDDGLQHKCDYLIFCRSTKREEQNKLYVLLIDLKSKNDSWIAQTIAGEAVALYLLRIFERYTGQKILKNNTVFRHIVFGTKRTYKNQTQGGRAKYQRDKLYDIEYTKRPCTKNYDLEMFLH